MKRNRRLIAPLAPLAAMAIAALLATACSSPGSSASGAGGSSTTGAGGSSTTEQALAYASCMRSHGVPNYPDPLSNGTFSGNAVTSGALGVSQGTLQAAQNACAHLQPKSPLPDESVEEILTKYLKFAACMRSHGVPDFPDPTVTGQSVGWTIPGSLVQTSRYQTAQHDCQEFSPIPAGFGKHL
jgi:hypothetical protein